MASWVTILRADVKGQRLFKGQRAVRRQRSTISLEVCWEDRPVAGVAVLGMLVLWSFRVSYSKSLVCLSGTSRSSQRWFSFFCFFFFHCMFAGDSARTSRPLQLERTVPLLDRFFPPLEGKGSVFPFYPHHIVGICKCLLDCLKDKDAGSCQGI